MSVKVLSVVFVIVCCAIAKTVGYCQLQFPPDEAKRPTIVKKIGSRQVHILDKPSSIHFQNGEEITAYCNTSFINPSTYSGESVVIINCLNDQINNNYYQNSILLECDTLTWNMYESATPFNWCPAPMESYILAQPSGRHDIDDFKVLAGICYNFEDMSVQSVHYVMAPESTQYLSQSRFREYVPSTKIQYILENFLYREIFISAYRNPQIRHWMRFAKYESHSLIQNANIFPESYIQLGGLLDFGWWSGLRLGNWQLYEEALSQHIETDDIEYDILAGISGTASAPIYKENCHDNQNRTMAKIVDEMNRKMPLYVWHYLKSARHESEHLVVIGVNSPFYEFYAHNEIVFCEDICPQIDWLQKVHSTFHYKAMGVIFCCSVDDVKASRRLTGFPTTTKPTTPTLASLIMPSLNTTESSSEALGNFTEVEAEYDDDNVVSSETDY